jgi:hypothetical protein
MKTESAATYIGVHRQTIEATRLHEIVASRSSKVIHSFVKSTIWIEAFNIPVLPTSQFRALQFFDEHSHERLDISIRISTVVIPGLHWTVR